MNRNHDNCVLLFVKYPNHGSVKTRLAERLGVELATELYKNFVADILKTLKSLPFDLKIFFDPPQDEKNVKTWLGSDYDYLPQRGDDLGQKMKNAFLTAFEGGYKRIVVIGSDCPDLPDQFIKDAVELLETNDAVIGPATDGGYYLLSFSKQSFLPQVFEAIQWSSAAVCKQTLGILMKHSRKVHLLPQWGDIDTQADLEELVLRNRDTAFYNSQTIRFLLNNRIISEAGSAIGSAENV